MAISDEQIAANRRISTLEEERAQLRACVALLGRVDVFFSRHVEKRDLERLQVRYEERLEAIEREIDLIEIARDYDPNP